MTTASPAPPVPRLSQDHNYQVEASNTVVHVGGIWAIEIMSFSADIYDAMEKG